MLHLNDETYAAVQTLNGAEYTRPTKVGKGEKQNAES